MLWILESKDLQSEVVVDVPCQRSGTCMSIVILQVILSNFIYLFCPILEIPSFLIIFLLDSFTSFYHQCNHKIKKTSIQNVWLGLDSWETFGSRPSSSQLWNSIGVQRWRTKILTEYDSPRDPVRALFIAKMPFQLNLIAYLLNVHFSWRRSSIRRMEDEIEIDGLDLK
jgi:hypothetical protein